MKAPNRTCQTSRSGIRAGRPTRRLGLESLERRDLLATLAVPAEYATISAAIEVGVDGDTILVAPGIYEENLTLTKDLQILGSGAEQTVIRGTSSKAAVIQISGASPEVVGFTITGGLNGGVAIDGGSPVLQDNHIWNNIRETAGGGISVTGAARPWILNNRIDQNRHYQGSGHSGGFGGGIYYAGSSGGVIAGNEITNNNAWARGGAIYIAGSPLVYGNSIYNNRGDFTGGIHIVSGRPIIQGNRIADNRHDYLPVQSAGVTVAGGSALIVNNSLYRNANGIYVAASTTDVAAINNIIFESGSEGIRADAAATLEYNDVFGQTSNYAGTFGVPGSGSISLAPQFTDPANYDFSLQPNSPAHHAGHPSAEYNNTDGSRNTMGDTGGPNPLAVTIVAVDDSVSVDEDAVNQLLAVLQNDQTDSSTIITEVTDPGRGEAVVAADGKSIAYTPEQDYFGEDTFSYVITNSSGATSRGRVVVTINPVNDPPTAIEDSTEVTASVQSSIIAVLANDTVLPDSGETLRLLSVTQGTAGGTVRIVGDAVEYTRPAPGFLGLDTFTYTVGDGTPGSEDTAQVTVYVAAEYLPEAMTQLLDMVAKAQTRYFTSPLSNNLAAGFTHSWFGTGTWREFVDGEWVTRSDLPRGQGSHVVPNEITLGFNVLALAFKSEWLDYLEEGQRWASSWGQIRRGLETLRLFQTSGNNDQFYRGAFYRAYKTVDPTSGDRDLQPGEIVRSGDEQSADDNGLLILNLLNLRGLALDSQVALGTAFRAEIVELIDSIVRDVDLRRFVVNDQIVFNFTRDDAGNDVPSDLGWDRISAEGSVLLAAMLATEKITVEEFTRILPSLENYPVVWQTENRGQIDIQYPSFHSAGFMHAIRQMHGMAVTEAEVVGATYFRDSLKPVFEVQVEYALAEGLESVGSQVMTQPFNGAPLFEEVANPGILAQYPGNEEGRWPVYGSTLSAATAPHGFFQPLARFRELQSRDIVQLFAWIERYLPGFFHAGSDTQLGFPAAIPWTSVDQNFSWTAGEEVFYTDNGNPYDALTSAYLVLSVFDALNPDAPLSSYNSQAGRLGLIAANFDNNLPLPAEVFQAAGIAILETAGATEISEGGPDDRYFVRLASRPIADVTLAIVASDTLATSPASLRFTPDNWDQPQAVQVRAPGDDIAGGTRVAQLLHTSNSLDPNYHQLDLPGVDARINDDDGAVSWAVREGQAGPSPQDAFHSVAFDPAGNVIAAGATMGFSDSGNHPSDADVLVAKYAMDGSLLWRYQVGQPDQEGDNAGDDDERASRVAVDEEGNIYISGSLISEQVDFDPLQSHPGDVDILVTAGSFDGFLLKLDAAGRFQWVIGLGGNSGIWDSAAGVAAVEGRVFISGQFGGTVDFDTRRSHTDGRDRLTAAGQADAYVAQYDDAGNFLTAVSMGGTEHDDASGLLVTDDAVYVFGTFQSNADFDRGGVDPTGQDIRQSVGGSDAFIAALDRDFNFRWVSAIGGLGYQQVTGLDVGMSGQLFASGYFQDTVDFDDGSGVHTASSINAGFDAFYLGMSPGGEVSWVSTAATTGDDRATGISAGPSSIWVSGSYFNASGFLRQISDDGEVLGELSISGQGTANPYAVATDGKGNVMAVGSFAGQVSVSTAVEDLLLTATTPGRDAFVSRLVADSATANARPTITSPGDVRGLEDQANGPLAFVVDDRETQADELIVTATSSNPLLLPNDHIAIDGSGANRSLTLTPAANQSGTSEVTLTVVDAHGQATSISFSYTVDAVNDLPAITTIADQTTSVDLAVGPLAFTVDDVETPPGDLVLAAVSSNENLLPVSAIEFSGIGASRFVTLRPAANQFGEAVVVVTVEDQDGEVTSVSFRVTVEHSTAMVLVSMEAIDDQGMPLTTITRGSRFRVVVSVEDVRRAPTGVFSSYLDLTFDSGRLSVDGGIEHANDYLDGISGTSSDGLIDELGGFSKKFQPLGGGKFALATIPMLAKTVGTTVIQGDPADEAGHEFLVYGTETPVPIALIEFLPLSLQVVPPWQNPLNRYDVNNDKQVTPVDALIGINRINAQGAGPLPPPNSTAPPPYYDVDGDNHHSPNDILTVINYLNAAANGEGEFMPPPVLSLTAEPVSRRSLARSFAVSISDEVYSSDVLPTDVVPATVWNSVPAARALVQLPATGAATWPESSRGSFRNGWREAESLDHLGWEQLLELLAECHLTPRNELASFMMRHPCTLSGRLEAIASRVTE